MTWWCAPPSRGLRIVFGIGFLLPFVLAFDGCPKGDRERAIYSVVVKFIEENVASVTLSENLRVHLYRDVLPTGTVVRPYWPEVDPGQHVDLTCSGDEGCRLFFIDTDHWAHFAHPTVVVLWDPGAAPNQVIRWVEGEWWPLVNGQPVFDTVRKREDWKSEDDPDPMSTIVFPRSRDLIESLSDQMAISVIHQPVSPPPTSGLAVFSPAVPCSAWAVLVAGHDDESDTFDEDIEAMETVLRGYGVSPSHIFSLSTRNNGGGLPDEVIRLTATKANVEDVLTTQLINRINALGMSCSDLLFFYASHGYTAVDPADPNRTVGYLKCVGGPIADTNLQSWLAGVPCTRVAVVLEACKSGSFIAELRDVPPLNPTQTERLLITSTNDTGSTWRDKDEFGGVMDSNPGDIGSETIWGFTEAYGTGIAAISASQQVSFSDAFNYAKKHDLKHRVLLNDPQMRSNSANSTIVPSCVVQPASPGLMIDLTQPVPTDPARNGELARCRCNVFLATVSSGGGTPPPVATARFFWTTEEDPKWNLNAQPHFKEVWDSTQLISAPGYPHEFELKWEVGTAIKAGSVITLLAIVDSPHAKIPEGEMLLSDLLAQTSQASALRLEVINPSSCCLFPCKGGSRTCD